MFTSGRCHLVVVAIETGGRWSDEAADFVWQMAQAKSREVPSFMNRSVALVWERRRTRVLSTVCAVSSAVNLHLVKKNGRGFGSTPPRSWLNPVLPSLKPKRVWFQQCFQNEGGFGVFFKFFWVFWSVCVEKCLPHHQPTLKPILGNILNP